MFHGDHAVAAIEVMHVAGADVGGADGQTGAAAIDEIEIDQLFERLLQGGGRVVTGALPSQHKSVAGASQWIRSEEAGNAVSNRRPIRELFVEAWEAAAKIPNMSLLHPLLELA